MAFSDYSALAVLNWITGRAAMPSPPTVYVSLFTAAGTDAGTGFTEVSGNGYARVATSASTWSAPSGSAPSSISNASVITFPTATGGSWGTIVAAGLYDAATAGDFLGWGWLGNFNWLPFTCSSASPGVLTAPAHGYTSSNSVVVTNEYGGTLPATAGSWGGILTATVLTVDTLTVAVSTTSTGNGQIRQVFQQSVPNNITVSFQTGALSITLA